MPIIWCTSLTIGTDGLPTVATNGHRTDGMSSHLERTDFNLAETFRTVRLGALAIGDFEVMFNAP